MSYVPDLHQPRFSSQRALMALPAKYLTVAEGIRVAIAVMMVKFFFQEDIEKCLFEIYW